MRSLIFYAIIAYLFYGGITNFNKWREAGTPLETPIAGADLAGLSFGVSGFGEPNIATNDKWGEILVGTWNFNFALDEGKEKAIFKGKVTYSNDGTFTRRVSYFTYDKFHKRNKAMAGGTINGKWSVKTDSTWVEMVKEDGYSLKVANGAEGLMADMLLQTYFSDSTYYGVMEHNTKDFELLYFNNSKIEIRSKDLSDGLIDTYSFIRSSE